MSSTSQFARITVGSDVFTWGDGRLRDVTIKLGEGAQSSSVRFSVYDPGGLIANRYFTTIKENEGLEPLVSSQPQSTGDRGSTALGDASVNVRAFLDLIAHAEGGEYNVRFGGATFDSFADHPRIRSNGSDAAGRYQFLASTWDTLGQPDFTPASQDRAAVAYILERGALDEIEAGQFTAAFSILNTAWVALPGGSQQRVTSAEALTFLAKAQQGYAPSAQAQRAATESTQVGPPKERSVPQESLQGQQITVELGRNGSPLVAYSFLHTGLRFDRFGGSVLEFTGQAAIWVLTQRRKNTAYTNLTLRQVATQICNNYGLTLVMNEPGPLYEYFPQRGVSDYQALLYECRRLGYRLTNVGNTVEIYARSEKVAGSTAYVVNSGDTTLSFIVTHEAQGESPGGARTSDPSETTTTGVRKVALDPDTGQLVTIRVENTTGAGVDTSSLVTGAAQLPVEPLTDGATRTADNARRTNEQRVKGIVVNASIRQDELALELTPDSTVESRGFGDFLDRAWVVESVTHTVSGLGAPKTDLVLYSPLRNRYPTPDPATASSTGTGATSQDGSDGSAQALNPGGWIRPVVGTVTSPFRSAHRPNHQGIDIGVNRGTPVWAAKGGTVTSVVTSCVEGRSSCGGRYGNNVVIDHGGGFTSLYAHLSVVNVTSGQSVSQAQQIGTSGNTGSSTGPHLHFEIRQAGVAQNPSRFIRF